MTNPNSPFSYTYDFIYGEASRVQRAHRINHTSRYVVDVENGSGGYLELDADDLDHAITLARLWVDPKHFGSRAGASAQINRAFADGTLTSVPGALYWVEDGKIICQAHETSKRAANGV